MITLKYKRHYVLGSSEHPTLADAVSEAVWSIEDNTAYPVEISDGERVVWRNDGTLTCGGLEALAEGLGVKLPD